LQILFTAAFSIKTLSAFRLPSNFAHFSNSPSAAAAVIFIIYGAYRRAHHCISCGTLNNFFPLPQPVVVHRLKVGRNGKRQKNLLELTSSSGASTSDAAHVRCDAQIASSAFWKL
jgi:hypothetical protein